MNFYSDVIEKTISQKLLQTTDTVLAVCAGKYDRDVFANHGFENILISNLDHHGGVKDYAPYEWERQDAEDIRKDNNSVDWAVVHAGLHHCASPHHALCEMLRVSRKGVIVFESRDGLLIRLAIKCGLTVAYELEPVALTKGASGGVRNSPIPNYIYRWTELEIRKTVASFLPQYVHTYIFHYGYEIPIQRLAMSPNPIKRLVANTFSIVLPAFERLLPKQGNRFAFIVTKDGPLQQWLKRDEDGQIHPDKDYLKTKFDTHNYKR